MSKTRNYGIDLLKAVSMLMIICLHILGNGGVLNNTVPMSLKGEVIWLLEICCFCAVNCYGLISGYVGFGTKHKLSNLIYLWIQVMFISLLSSAITLVVGISKGASINYLGLIKSSLPVLSGEFWYFSAYFCLFLFMPLLDILVEKAPRELLKKSFVLALVVFCILDPMKESLVFSLRRGYSVIWLAILYLIGAYIAKYDVLKRLSAKKSFLLYAISCLLTFATRIVIGLVTGLLLGVPQKQDILIEYIFIFVLSSAVFLLSAFSKINIKKSFLIKTIMLLSTTSFGVYIIHTTPFVWKMMNGKFAWMADINIILTCLLLPAFAVCIYLMCAIVDIIRKAIFKMIRIKELCLWLDGIIEKLLQRINNAIPTLPKDGEQ